MTKKNCSEDFHFLNKTKTENKRFPENTIDSPELKNVIEDFFLLKKVDGQS